jgi:DNA-binding CsgD family transcriptional regulator/tetratricopeptide (TPR) repeat protein
VATIIRSWVPDEVWDATVIIAGMPVRISSPVLIGRVDELGRMVESIDAARRGHGTALLIAGEAGVGKTRLVASLVDRAEATGLRVLSGGCIDVGDGAVPYAPFVEALRGLVRRLGASERDAIIGPARAELARLVPDLGPVTESAGSALDLGSAQGRLFELLLAVLERLAATTPVLIVIEDLHWSDRSTRELFAFLVRNLRDLPITLVASYRTDELHRRHPLLPFLAELERSGRVERVELERFDRPDLAAQLRAIAGHDVDPLLVDSIHTRSGGNAFFAEELLASAGEDGTAELPATLRDVLLARVAELAESTQEFLRIASAAGQRVDAALVAAVGGLSETAVYAALRECVGRQVLVADPAAGAERYAFRHALLQEAVYDDLLPGERTRLHSAFARALETQPDGATRHAAELAYHWYAAHDLPRALEAAVSAGRAAEAGYAFPEALGLYERAIDLWEQVPDAEARAGSDRVDLLARAAGVARYHEPARALVQIQAAIDLVDVAADPIRSGLLHERLGRFAWVAGQGELAREAYEMAVSLIPPTPSAARARAVAGLAQIVMLGARFAESRRLAEEAHAIAREVGARDVEGHALNTAAESRAQVGEVEEALDDMREALAIAESVGVVDDIGRAYANWSWILDSVGRLEEAITVAHAGIAASGRLGLMRLFGVHMLCGVADAQFRLGRWDETEQLARRAEDLGPFGINEIIVAELLARLAMARGDLDDARRRLTPLAPLAVRANDVQFIAPVESAIGELAIWDGRPEAALDRLTDAIRLIEHTPEVRVDELFVLGIRAAADAAELARARRDPAAEAAALAAGDRILAALRQRHDEIVAERPVFAALSGAWLALGEAEALRAHRRPAVTAWVAAVAAWDAFMRPYTVAYARWRAAEAHLAARDRSAAQSSLRAARATAVALGAGPLLREIDGLAARGRLDLTAPDPVVGSESVAPDGRDSADEAAANLGLTAREIEVLALVAEGRTNRQIADALFISSNTAGVHVSNIIGKLGVASRGEAAAVAYRLGLLGPERDDA